MSKPDTLSHWADHGSRSGDNENMILLTPDCFAIHALQGLEVIGEEQDILKDIWKGVWNGKKEEALAKAVKELQKTSAWSIRLAKWALTDGILYFQGKIYVPDASNLWCRFIALCHDSKVTRHSGRWKTLELVSWNYWWPQMSRYIGKYVSTCDMCLQTKASRQPPSGKLHPLPIPDAPWDTISVDFIVELPELAGHNSIMVMVDSITKCAHFIDTVTTLSTARTAQLYLQHVWKHHGLPWKVVSD